MLADVLAAAGGSGDCSSSRRARRRLPDGVRTSRTRAAGRAQRSRRAGRGRRRRAPAPYLVVNADLPVRDPARPARARRRLPDGGLALAPAADGTTNALALVDDGSSSRSTAPAAPTRYAALAPAALVDAPNLVDDVDTLADLAPRAASRPAHARLFDALRLGGAA